MHHSCYMWILVIATAVWTDTITGHEDKVGIKSQQTQQQQQSDIMQTMADGGGHQSIHMTSPAESYFNDPLGPLGYLAKRAHKQYGFGLGKRLYRQYEFGLGKRSTSKQYGFGLGKRAALKQYEFGLGKRASPTFYSFGLGRRASPQYSFGLGKRVSHPSFLNVDDRESDYTYNDLSEERKRTADDMGHGQRFAFGLGKRGAGAEWEDGDGDGDDAAPIWHPAVRRARLQYGFGLGKRADRDYDAAAGMEYADTLQLADDVATTDINN
ncbi:allatostatins [Melanaphis sacchari]|uniref:allatostatins n=1 Tax=Melanaphis sacchari TaxID=742174 RepID=UPI000DC15303|nr:allatostatins [Melanaphis sacchari]